MFGDKKETSKFWLLSDATASSCTRGGFVFYAIYSDLMIGCVAIDPVMINLFLSTPYSFDPVMVSCVVFDLE